MKKLVIVLIVLLLLIFSFVQVDLRLGEVIAYDNLENIFKFLAVPKIDTEGIDKPPTCVINHD